MKTREIANLIIDLLSEEVLDIIVVDSLYKLIHESQEFFPEEEEMIASLISVHNYFCLPAERITVTEEEEGN